MTDTTRVKMKDGDLNGYLAKVCFFDWDDGVHVCGLPKRHDGDHLCAGCDDTAGAEGERT